MTLTLELTPEQEEKLRAKAEAAGVELNEYATRKLVEDAILTSEEPTSGETLGERLERLGVLGAFESRPRPDGRPWSEIEGYEFE